MGKRNVVATWTGSYPCLCHGEWMLEVDGKDYTEAIPKDYRTENMGTYGTYEQWDIGESGHVEWDTYTDGLEKDEWIKENAGWLKNIPADPKDICDAFNAEDFRAGECGGCI